MLLQLLSHYLIAKTHYVVTGKTPATLVIVVAFILNSSFYPSVLSDSFLREIQILWSQ